MIVRIRFERGTSVSRRAGKNARISHGLSTLGTLGAISCGTLGFWRVAKDLGWAGDFVFPSGFLSHWQVWMTAAGALQYASWRLARHGRSAAQSQAASPRTAERAERTHAAAGTQAPSGA